MPLYKLEYEQRNEVFVEAQDHDEARELITEYTENGGSNMHQIRLIECGWSITENFGLNVEYSTTSVDSTSVGDYDEFYVEGLITY